MLPPSQETIRQLIIDGAYQEAFADFKKLAAALDVDLVDDISLIESNYKISIKKNRLQTITPEQFTTYQARNTASFLALLNDLPAHKIENGKVVIQDNSTKVSADTSKSVPTEEVDFYQFIYKILSTYLTLIVTTGIAYSFIYDNFNSFIIYAFIILLIVSASVSYALLQGKKKETGSFLGIFSCALLCFYLSMPLWYENSQTPTIQYLISILVCYGIGYLPIKISHFLANNIHNGIYFSPAIGLLILNIFIILGRLSVSDEDINSTLETSKNILFSGVHKFYAFYAVNFTSSHEQVIFSIAVLSSFVYIIFTFAQPTK